MSKILLSGFFIYALVFTLLSGQNQAALLLIALISLLLLFSIFRFSLNDVNTYAVFFIISIAVGITLITHLKHFVVQPYKVENRSMTPLLQPGDNVIIEKISMGIIINFYEKNIPVKRLQLPGMRKLKEGDVVILKNPLTYNNVIKRIHSIENEKFCVYGDNLANSLDSRRFGCVEKEAIIGRMIYHYKMST
jgi:signal peptidase I